MILEEDSLETIFAKFSNEWRFLWVGGDDPLNDFNQSKIETDLQNAIQDAYDMGWQDGKADARE